ncbi:hypothetical protein [Solwaraspora sp. WMMA2101]|uniref:hypothetical protein n=1 Tax=Solwaraspora sp. WMMA2101 TaxID=3404124 RepID=UPI003B9378FF
MIYTSSGVGSARRWIRWWPAATAVTAVALGGLLLLALVACGSGTGRLSGHPDAADATGSAGLGGAPAATGSSGEPQTGDDDGGAEHDPGGSGGDSSGDGGDGGPEVTAAAEDCVGYDPANLTIQQQGDAWLMRDGNHAIKNFATKVDAEDGVKVARNWTRICYIGRGNDRPDRHRYIITYFQDPSGLPFGPAPHFDCIPYDPAELAVHGPDGDGWGLRAAATPLLFLASAADAERARLVASGNRQLCVIGQGNGMPDPARYQLEHWRQ